MVDATAQVTNNAPLLQTPVPHPWCLRALSLQLQRSPDWQLPVASTDPRRTGRQDVCSAAGGCGELDVQPAPPSLFEIACAVTVDQGGRGPRAAQSLLARWPAVRGGSRARPSRATGYECACEESEETARLQEASRAQSLQGREPLPRCLRAVITPGRRASLARRTATRRSRSPDATHVGNFTALQHIESLPRLDRKEYPGVANIEASSPLSLSGRGRSRLALGFDAWSRAGTLDTQINEVTIHLDTARETALITGAKWRAPVTPRWALTTRGLAGPGSPLLGHMTAPFQGCKCQSEQCQTASKTAQLRSFATPHPRESSSCAAASRFAVECPASPVSTPSLA